MAPVRGRPLGPLGWLLTRLLELAVSEGMEPEPAKQDALFVARGPESTTLERKAA